MYFLHPTLSSASIPLSSPLFNPFFPLLTPLLPIPIPPPPPPPSFFSPSPPLNLISTILIHHPSSILRPSRLPLTPSPIATLIRSSISATIHRMRSLGFSFYHCWFGFSVGSCVRERGGGGLFTCRSGERAGFDEGWDAEWNEGLRIMRDIGVCQAGMRVVNSANGKRRA